MSDPQPQSSTMATHDSTDPPAMPQGQPSSPDSTGPWIIEKVKKAREEAREALESSRETSMKVDKIVDTMGVSSNQALGTPGSGLLGGFDRLSSKVGDLSASQEKLTKAVAAAMWAAKVVVGAILTAATGAGIVWVTTLHH